MCIDRFKNTLLEFRMIRAFFFSSKKVQLRIIGSEIKMYFATESVIISLSFFTFRIFFLWFMFRYFYSAFFLLDASLSIAIHTALVYLVTNIIVFWLNGYRSITDIRLTHAYMACHLSFRSLLFTLFPIKHFDRQVRKCK